MPLLIAAVAFLYSLVGHGGASGYLAVLSLAGVEPGAMKLAAWILNLVVAGIAFANYRQAGHFDRRLFWPFALGSIPAAFAAGRLEVSPAFYSALLGVVLLLAAVRMWLPERSVERTGGPPVALALAVGVLLGFLAGVLGIGGGIFLSPLLLLAGWADAKRTSAVSAAFIWVNSAAGLAGYLARGHAIAVPWIWVAAASVASVAGSWLGARRLTTGTLRRCLGVVLLLAALKLLRG